MPNPNPFAVSEKQAQLIEHVTADLSPCHDRILIRQFTDIDITYLDEIAKDLRMRTSMNNPEGRLTNYVDDPYVGNIGPEDGGRVYEGRWRGVSVRTNIRNGRGTIIQTLAYGLVGSYHNDYTITVDGSDPAIVTTLINLPYNIVGSYLYIEADDGSTNTSAMYKIASRDSDLQMTLETAWNPSDPISGRSYLCSSLSAPCALWYGNGLEISTAGPPPYNTATRIGGIFPTDFNLSIAGRYKLRLEDTIQWFGILSYSEDASSITFEPDYPNPAGATDALYTIYDVDPLPEIVQTDDKLMFPHAAIWQAEKEQKEVRYRGIEPKFVEAYKNTISLINGVMDVRSLRMQDGSYNIHALTDENFWVLITNESEIEHTRIREYSIDDEKTTNRHIRDFLHATKDSADQVFDDPAPDWVTLTAYEIGDLVKGQILVPDSAPPEYIEGFAIAVQNYTSAASLQDDIDANNMAKVVITKTTMKDNTDGSGMVRQEMKEIEDELGDPYISRENEIVNPFGCGKGEKDSLIFKWKDLSQESMESHFDKPDSYYEALAQVYIPNIEYVKKKWEVHDDGTCTLWVLLVLYTRMSFWDTEPTDPEEPWVDGIPEGPCYYEVVNIGTEYETHIKKWFGIQRSDHSAAFLYLTNQVTRPAGFVLGELRIRDTQQNAFDYTQVVIKQAKTATLTTSGVTSQNRYKVLNVLGLEVGNLDMLTVVYDNLLQVDLAATPVKATVVTDYAVADVIPTLQGNGRWRKTYLQYKVAWGNVVTEGGDPSVHNPTTWRVQSVSNEGGYGENTVNWASGVPVADAEDVVKDKEGNFILQASFSERQLGEAHITYAERTGVYLGIETTSHDRVGNSPAMKKFTWYGVDPDNITTIYGTTAPAYQPVGFTHKGVDMNVQPNGFATIVATAVDYSTYITTLYTPRPNVTKKFFEKRKSEPNAGYRYFEVTITYDIDYHLSEGAAYDAIEGGLNYMGITSNVVQVSRGNIPYWRSIYVWKIATEAGQGTVGPVNVDLTPPSP